MTLCELKSLAENALNGIAYFGTLMSQRQLTEFELLAYESCCRLVAAYNLVIEQRLVKFRETESTEP
jgi:hypothetical protein